jgi:hypothetical protein
VAHGGDGVLVDIDIVSISVFLSVIVVLVCRRCLGLVIGVLLGVVEATE